MRACVSACVSVLVCVCACACACVRMWVRVCVRLYFYPSRWVAFNSVMWLIFAFLLSRLPHQVVCWTICKTVAWVTCARDCVRLYSMRPIACSIKVQLKWHMWNLTGCVSVCAWVTCARDCVRWYSTRPIACSIKVTHITYNNVCALWLVRARACSFSYGIFAYASALYAFLFLFHFHSTYTSHSTNHHLKGDEGPRFVVHCICYSSHYYLGIFFVGFARELHAIFAKLPDRKRLPRQTLLFSATVPPEVQQIAREGMCENKKNKQTNMHACIHRVLFMRVCKHENMCGCGCVPVRAYVLIPVLCFAFHCFSVTTNIPQLTMILLWLPLHQTWLRETKKRNSNKRENISAYINTFYFILYYCI